MSYAKYRRELLQAGVELFELKLRAGQPTGRQELKPLGLSGAALRAKLSPSTTNGCLSVRSISIRDRRT